MFLTPEGMTSCVAPLRPHKLHKTESQLQSNTCPNWKLPAELMQRVGHFIQEEKCFFDFLGAFDDTEAIGELHSVLALTSDFPRAMFWPNLALDHDKIANYPHNLASLTPCYDTVTINGQVAWTLLDQFIDRSTSLVWSHRNTPEVCLKTWLEHLYAYHVVSMAIDDNVIGVVEILCQFVHLRKLHMTFFDDSTTNALLEYVQHSKLTSLSLNGNVSPHEDEILRLTSANFCCLTRWLVNNAVLDFKWTGFRVTANKRTMMDFYAAAFTKPSHSLRRYAYEGQTISEFDTIVFAQAMTIQTLTLESAGLTATSMAALVVGLVDSNVQNLSINSNNIGPAGVNTLVRSLARTKIQKLNLRNVGMDDTTCCILATVLPQSRVKELNIIANNMTTVGACALGPQLAQCAYLEAFYAEIDELGVVGATALIEGMGNRQSGPPAVLCIINEDRTEEDAKLLEAFSRQFPRIDKCFLFEGYSPCSTWYSLGGYDFF
ncbi:Aste57867_9700 [Aphanomyces stellatus]|uniref:Aste57867_9700 protein n=1 Tax=Aphanomyces stellatus TaxID=120398 RepID=A0A485KNU9_9STRA|nr:hypothetical protein As57867_009662 [Aphanomyces stellatus]VFT86579.1 Aste57867_9700 [Aphanomyces stellatus]